MIDATVLATFLTDTVLEVFGVWIPRKGDNTRVIVEVVHNYNTNFSVLAFEKNYDDAGDGTSTGDSITFNATDGRQTLEVLGSKELLRFKVTLARGENLGEEDVGVIYFRLLQPVWFEAVKV